MAVDFGKTFRLTGVLGCPLCRLRRRRLRRRRRHSRRGILDFSSPRDWGGLFYVILGVSMVRDSTRVFHHPLLFDHQFDFPPGQQRIGWSPLSLTRRCCCFSRLSRRRLVTCIIQLLHVSPKLPSSFPSKRQALQEHFFLGFMIIGGGLGSGSCCVCPPPPPPPPLPPTPPSHIFLFWLCLLSNWDIILPLVHGASSKV